MKKLLTFVILIALAAGIFQPLTAIAAQLPEGTALIAYRENDTTNTADAGQENKSFRESSEQGDTEGTTGAPASDFESGEQPEEITGAEEPVPTAVSVPTENPEPTANPGPTEEPVPTVSLVPTEEPMLTEPVFPAALIPETDAEAFEETNPMTGTMAGVFLADITNGTLIASNNASMLASPSELNEWMLLLYVLRNTSGDTVVTITKEMLAQATAASYPELFGFEEGDTVTIAVLETIFILTGADDARCALIAASARTEENAVSKMNQVTSKIGMSGTLYTATDGAYAEGQHTTAYDLYALFRELLGYRIFYDTISKSSVRISYTRKDSTGKNVICKNMEAAYSNLYGEIQLPDGYQYFARMSGGSKESGLSQIMLATGTDGTMYLSVLAGIPFEKDVSIETERLFRVLLKESYYDMAQELPLGDDTVRYEYLLGTEVVYYTINNKAPGYETAAAAERYMMQITVPCWKLNSDGTRTSSTFSLTINRKLVASVRAIFQEIYELPIQFPLKVLKGYGYRKSGGVGLSNCTLMSVHSYGAAIDINPGDYDNDYYLGAGNDLRDASNPYCIPEEVIRIFEKYGWYWGGDFEIAVDSMHFQYLGLDFLSYQGNSPFRTLSLEGDAKVGIDVENLETRLAALGYRVNRNGIYTVQTRSTVMKFQARNGLPVTGEVDYKTWETLINLTHYLSYAF